MSNASEQQRHQHMKRRGQIIAIALIAIVALPMLLAYVLYFTGVGVPDDSVNEGTLLSPPQPFTDWQPETEEGEAWTLSEDRKRWRLLVPIDADCTGHCEDNLYLTRQVHVRLAEKAYRVERLILPLDGRISDEMSEFLAQEHPGVEVLYPDSQSLEASLGKTNLAEDPIEAGRYYLVDQEGFVMMGYTPEHRGKQLLKDIKRLLRYSYED